MSTETHQPDPHTMKDNPTEPTIHRIADRQPEFPCWLWCPKMNRIEGRGWRFFECAVNIITSTHWTHSDTRPTVVPDTQPSADVERVAEELESCVVWDKRTSSREWVPERAAAILRREFGEPRTYRMANGSIVTGPRAVELLEFEEQRLRKAYDEIAELKQRICVDTPQMLALNAELLDQRDRAEAALKEKDAEIARHQEGTVIDLHGNRHLCSMPLALACAGFVQELEDTKRKLEHARGELRNSYSGEVIGARLRDYEAMKDRAERAEAELADLARCQFGPESEAEKLRIERDQLRAELARLQGQTRWQCACGGTDCDGQRENEQLRAQLAAARKEVQP